MQEWNDQYIDKLEKENTLTLLLRYFEDKFNFSAEKFMEQARAVEILHRRTESNEVWSKDKYDNLLNKILDNPNLSEEEKKWVRSKLFYGNEPTLKN